MARVTKAEDLWLALEDEALIDRRQDPAMAILLRWVMEQTMVDHARRVAIEQTRGTLAQEAKELSGLEVTSTRMLAMLDEMALATQIRIGHSVEAAREAEAARRTLVRCNARIVCAQACLLNQERRGRPRNEAVRTTIEELTLWFDVFTASSADPYEPAEYAEARWNFIEISFRVCKQTMPTKLKIFVMALPRPSHEVWWHLGEQAARWREREFNT